MNRDDFDGKLRGWMDDSAPRVAPESLAETLERVTALPAEGIDGGGRRAVPWPSLRLVRGAAGIAAALAVVLGGGLLFVARGPAVPASPKPTPLSGPLWLSKPTAQATLDATVPVLAGSDEYVVASGWNPRAGGSTCSGVPALVLDGSHAARTTTGWDGEIFAVPASSGSASSAAAGSEPVVALGADRSCAPALLTLDAGGKWSRVSLDPSVMLLEGETGPIVPWPAGHVAVWNSAASTIDFLPKDGSAAPSLAGAVAPPIGNAVDGLYWMDASRQFRVDLWNADPIARPMPQSASLPAGASGLAVLYKRQVVFEEPNGGLGVARLDGTSSHNTLPGFTVWHLAAGRNFVGAVGEYGGQVAVAVSSDGQHWEFEVTQISAAKENGSTAALAVTADHLFFAVPADGGAGVTVYSVAVSNASVSSTAESAVSAGTPVVRASTAVDCGVLSSQSCSKAVAAALRVVLPDRVWVTPTVVERPTSAHPCPHVLVGPQSTSAAT